MNVHADDVMMFRQRPHPTNPDKMFYDVWLFELVPDGEEWPERPKHKRFKHGDKSIGQVLDQDAFNLPTVQKGMHSDAFKGLWIGDQELRIRHSTRCLTITSMGRAARARGTSRHPFGNANPPQAEAGEKEGSFQGMICSARTAGWRPSASSRNGSTRRSRPGKSPDSPICTVDRRSEERGVGKGCVSTGGY